MAELEYKSLLKSQLPQGFKTTHVESDRLRRLEGANISVLNDTVEDYGNNRLQESQVIRREVNRVLTSFVTPESTLELPGTALELENEHILQFAAEYKEDNDTPSGTIKTPDVAGTDDIVFSFADPEVYEEISGVAVDNFIAGNQTAGSTLEVVGDQGIDFANNSNAANLSLDDDEWLFFTGDYIDLSDGKSVITKTQWTDIDGEDFGPVDALFSSRLSGAHILTTQGAWVQSTCDLDAKVYDDGDVELVPVAFYMAPGTKAPGLN